MSSTEKEVAVLRLLAYIVHFPAAFKSGFSVKFHTF